MTMLLADLSSAPLLYLGLTFAIYALAPKSVGAVGAIPLPTRCFSRSAA